MEIRKEKPPATAVPCPSGVYFIVEKGDTLWSVSQQLNVSIESLLKSNPSIEPNNLKLNQRICIPDTINNNSQRQPFNRP